MSGTLRTRSTRRTRHRWWRVIHRTVAVSAMLFLIAEIAVVAVSSASGRRAPSRATPPTGQGFTVTTGDLKFILKQIKIAEHHRDAHATIRATRGPCGALVGIPDADQIPDRLTAYGLRTVDGSCNNLFPGRETFAAADQLFPRLADTGLPGRRGRAGRLLGPAARRPSSSYKQKKGNVFDSQPRVDQQPDRRPDLDEPGGDRGGRVPGAHAGQRPGVARARPTPTRPRPAGRRRSPPDCVAVAPDAVHPERHHRRRPLAAVQLACSRSSASSSTTASTRPSRAAARSSSR